MYLDVNMSDVIYFCMLCSIGFDRNTLSLNIPHNHELSGMSLFTTR